jgi:hypothetical protein
VDIWSREQSSVHFCATVKVTEVPSILLIVIGTSLYFVLPSESISRTPMTHKDDGGVLGTELGISLGI